MFANAQNAQIHFVNLGSHPSGLINQYLVVGAPDRNRTCDLRLRRPTLYPTELQARFSINYLLISLRIILVALLQTVNC